MTGRKVLDRLLRLREMEEEQSRHELEAAVGDRNRVAAELKNAIDRQAMGRRSLVSGIEERDCFGRTSAVIEMERARRMRMRVEPRLEAAEVEVKRQREEFLLRRAAREQVETLVDQERAATLEKTGRRAQQMLDDWYGRRTPSDNSRPGNGTAVGLGLGDGPANETAKEP